MSHCHVCGNLFFGKQCSVCGAVFIYPQATKHFTAKDVDNLLIRRKCEKCNQTLIYKSSFGNQYILLCPCCFDEHKFTRN
jgi:hypothetical protein